MKTAVLFVHGLGGRKDTWGAFQELIDSDEELNCSPFFYEYSSAVVRVLPFVQNKYGNIQALSKALKTYIEHILDNYEEIVLVGHSLGGLIIRQYLLDQKISSYKTKIRKVIFYAVPQEGSELANIASLISFDHRHLKQLCKNSEYLDTLNDLWAQTKIENDFEFKVVVAVEDAVISPQSAKSNFRHLSPAHVAGNHRTIVKPQNKDDLNYLVLKKFLCESIRITKDRPNGALLFEEWILKDDVGPFFPDAKREQLINDLIEAIQKPQSAIRLVGLSGLGKTRAAIEALKQLSEEKKDSIVYIDVAFEPSELVQSINKWVSDGFSGILVADNCTVSLHDQLLKAVLRPESKLALLTLDSDLERSGKCMYVELGRLDNEMIKKMLAHTFGNSLPGIDRVVEFAQGFPQMAILIAEARINEEPDLGKLTDDWIAHKLLWGSKHEKNISDEKVLIGCSLFDRFGLENGASAEFQYIADHVVHIDQGEFYGCVKRFVARGLIDQRGRYAQLVPKPLAIRLAAQWWSQTLKQGQEDLINGMPNSMVTSFCDQIEKLDFLPEVKNFTASLCGHKGPFGQAEVILSDRGSRLFRALVNVNPDTTSSALYQIVTQLSHEQILAINSNVRRNLVWALEKLCFHANLFEESTWVLFLLAMDENETWSNNATGVFSQLFRVQGSGTAAEPKMRFDLLRRALTLRDEKADLVILKALEKAINLYGGYRTVGAEYQGTKAPLEEWRPTIWQEIFDYWHEAFSMLIEMLDRGSVQNEKSMSAIGHSIRGFVNHGRLEMLDAAIRHVISRNGRYWPSALDNIKTALEFDAKEMKPEGLKALNTWLVLLEPDKANLEERLKIIVIHPPWEHRQDEEGHYIDVAAENAEQLAIELSTNIQQLIEYIPLLLSGEQNQTFVFGRRLAIESHKTDDFIELAIAELGSIDNPNRSLVMGLLSGTHAKSIEVWNSYLAEFSSRDELIKFYPDVLCTGEMQSSHLSILLELIRQGRLQSISASVFNYGRVTAHLSGPAIATFCMELAKIDAQGAWTALGILFMYCHGDANRFEENRSSIRVLVITVPLNKEASGGQMDLHHWAEITKKLLRTEELSFCKDICRQIITATNYGFNHGDIYHYIKPLLINLMQVHGVEVWTLFGEAIVSAETNQKYWLEQLFERENDVSNQTPSVFSKLPTDLIISWCNENKEIGPRFVASCINVFEMVDGSKEPNSLFTALLEHFGDDVHLGSALSANLGSRSWSGSLVPYLESDKAALEPLLKHSNSNVRRWVEKHISYIDRQIKYESMRDDEEGLGIY